MDKTLKEKLAQILADDAPKKEEKKDATDEKQVKELSAGIAESITKQVFEKLEASKKASDDSEKKAAKLNEVGASVASVTSPKIEVAEYQKSIYTKKNGKELVIGKSAAQDLGRWYKATAKHDSDGANDIRNEINSKYASITKNGVEPMNETNTADGGALVPTILANFIVEIKEDVAKMKSNSYGIDMTDMPSNTLDISKELTNPKVAWGGIEQYDTDKSTTSAQYETQTLTPYTVAGIITITNQLIADSPFSMVQILSRQLGRALATEEDRVAINGTGVNQPTGISTYTASSTVDAGDNLAFQHLNTAYWSMREAYRNTSTTFWIMNSSRMGLVQGLRDANNRPIYIDATLTTELPKLNNIRILENNNVANNRIYLVNLDYYMWAYKDGISIDIADQASVGSSDPINLWMRNMKAIRAEQRYDAELVDTRGLVSITNP